MFRVLSLFWIAVSLLMLVLAYSGLADGVLHSAISCGADGETARTCRPHEASHALVLIGWIGLATGAAELAFAGRLRRVLTF